MFFVNEWLGAAVAAMGLGRLVWLVIRAPDRRRAEVSDRLRELEARLLATRNARDAAMQRVSALRAQVTEVGLPPPARLSATLLNG